MPEIRIDEEIAASADAAWKVLADFGGLAAWAPGVTRCELEGSGVGAVRSVEVGGNSVRERLERLDDAARTLSYSVQGAPVQNYRTTIALSDLGSGRSRILWTASFDAPGLSEEQAQGIARGVEAAYRGMIEGLRKAAGG